LRRISTFEGVIPQPYYLSDSGRLVFDTQDSLSPGDTNNGVEDVYESEPPGVGSCNDGNGCVRLISSGSGTGDSNFLAMDRSGANIFFTTTDRLSPKDEDGLVDLYDAREFGGIASEFAAPATECSGEACQLFTPPAVESNPASGGPGESATTKPITCKKGQARKKGRCVPKGHKTKKHKSKKKKAKQHASGHPQKAKSQGGSK
jgi:hypothetical protein